MFHVKQSHPRMKGKTMETQKLARVTEHNGLPLVENWGSFDVFGDATRSAIVEWRTGQETATYSGNLSLECARLKAEVLHLMHDVIGQ